MEANVRIEGADQLERVGRQLKELGDKDLRKELFRGFNRATKPLKIAVRTSAELRLPKRGGLNRFVAASRLSTRTRVSGKNVGVRIVAAKRGSDVEAIDRGRLRHPVFGNRRVWVTQQITPGWFTVPLVAGERTVQRELLQVIDDIERGLSRGGQHRL